MRYFTSNLQFGNDLDFSAVGALTRPVLNSNVNFTYMPSVDPLGPPVQPRLLEPQGPMLCRRWTPPIQPRMSKGNKYCFILGGDLVIHTHVSVELDHFENVDVLYQRGINGWRVLVETEVPVEEVEQPEHQGEAEETRPVQRGLRGAVPPDSGVPHLMRMSLQRQKIISWPTQPPLPRVQTYVL